MLPLCLVCSVWKGTRQWEMSFWRLLRFHAYLKCYHDIFAEKVFWGSQERGWQSSIVVRVLQRGIILVRFWPGCHRARVAKVWKEEEEKRKYSHTTQPYLLLTGSWLASGCCWVGDVAMVTLGVYWKTELYSGTCLAVLLHFLVYFFFFPFLVIAIYSCSNLDVLCWSTCFFFKVIVNSLKMSIKIHYPQLIANTSLHIWIHKLSFGESWLASKRYRGACVIQIMITQHCDTLSAKACPTDHCCSATSGQFGSSPAILGTLMDSTRCFFMTLEIEQNGSKKNRWCI